MKSWKLLFSMSLMVIAMGCGKSGGGGSSTQSYYSPYTGANLTGNNLTYMNELQGYSVNPEPTTLRRFSKVVGALSSSSSGSSCPGTVKTILGIQICVYGSTSSNSNSSNMLRTYYLAGLANGGDINYPLTCVTTNGSSCSQSEVGYGGKGSNANLNAAISGHNNTMTLLGVYKSGTVYQIAYGQGTLTTQPSVVYTIDTSLHSMYNPVGIANYTTLTQEYVEWY